VGFLAKLLLGSGTLKPELRAGLESEGLVRIEEGLTGSVRYERFRSPGRYQHGKITGVRVGLGISEARLVVYSHSGRAKLLDTAFSSPRLSMLDVSLKGDERIAIRVDYDRGDVPKVSGEITIVARTPNAAAIADELGARGVARRAPDDPA
jgi:hypothetical protein